MSGRGWNPAPTIFVRGLAGCVTVALVRVVATGRRGRRPLRLVCWRNPQRCRRCGAYSGAAHRGRCALRLRCCVGFERGAHRDGWSAVVAVGAGFHPRPDIKSKRRRRFTASRETAEEMTTHSHRRRQSIFLIDAALRAAATLFPSLGKTANAVHYSAETLPRPNVG